MISVSKKDLFPSKTKVYYHVIEDCGYGNIGCHGYYLTNAEAEKESERMQQMFNRSFFYVHVSTSKKEPNFITL
jgi:hypothetical protein